MAQDSPTRESERSIIVSIRPTKSARALTLVEVMLATVILGIAAVGALSFEYHADRHTKIARVQISGTNTARLLLEDWMSTGGAIDYAPTELDIGFSEDGGDQDKLILHGTITEAVRGVVGLIGGDGYLKYYYFDERVLEGVLPGDTWLRGKYIPAPAACNDYGTGKQRDTFKYKMA